MEGRFLQILSFFLPVLFLSSYQYKAHSCCPAGESPFGGVPGWQRLSCFRPSTMQPQGWARMAKSRDKPWAGRQALAPACPRDRTDRSRMEGSQGVF